MINPQHMTTRNGRPANEVIATMPEPWLSVISSLETLREQVD
jgi:hypothetical protein